MRSSLDCIPCFIRQALEAARAVSSDAALQEDVVREVLRWLSNADLTESPPGLARYVHRRLRGITGEPDPHREAKDRQNRIALDLVSELRPVVEAAADPLGTAVRLAIAGNVIDIGAKTDATGPDLHSVSHLRSMIDKALAEPLGGQPDSFYRAVKAAGSILYLADNAGEIAFDRLLIERLGPERVTVAVRGAPVINDATLVDAQAVGLDELVEVIDNGSDAPGTILAECSEEFRRRFAEADLVVAKGQGNFESLSDEKRDIFFLLKVKCRVIADHVGMPVGTHVLARSGHYRGVVDQ